MILFNKITFNNFLSYTQETEVNLDNQGLTLLIGKTGSGKSTLHTAMTWCLFSITARGTKVNEVINDTVEKDCYVIIEATVNGKSLIVRRYRNHGVKGNAFEVEFDGRPIPGLKATIQRILEEDILHMTFEQFTLLTLFANDKIRYFASETATERLKMLEAILNLERFEKAHKITQERLVDATKNVVSFETKLYTLESQLPRLTDMLQEIRTKDEEWQQQHDTEVGLLQTTLTNIEKQKEALGEKTKPTSIDTHVLDEEVYILTQRLAKDSIEKTQLEIQIQQSPTLDHLLLQPCPTCGQTVTAEVAQKVKEQYDLTREQHKRKIIILDRDMAFCEEEIAGKRKQLKELTAMFDKVNDDYREWEAQKNMLYYDVHNTTNRLEDVKLQKNPYTSTKVELEKNISLIFSELKQTQQLLIGENRVTEILQIIKEIFGRKGARFYFIKQCLDHIEREARKALLAISSGKIDLSLTLLENENLDLNVIIDGKVRSYAQLSHGESQAVNCGILFGLNRMTRQRQLSFTNILFLDEILDLSMDDSLNEGMFAFLQNLVQEVPSVFVITHKEIFKSLFPKVWEVVDGEINEL